VEVPPDREARLAPAARARAGLRGLDALDHALCAGAFRALSVHLRDRTAAPGALGRARLGEFGSLVRFGVPADSCRNLPCQLHPLRASGAGHRRRAPAPLRPGGELSRLVEGDHRAEEHVGLPCRDERDARLRLAVVDLAPHPSTPTRLPTPAASSSRSATRASGGPPCPR
jgi:hypothetical protein